MPEYLIQKYATGNWDAVRGRVPFVASGPNFDRYVIAGSLQRLGEHRFTRSLLSTMEEVLGGLGGDWRDVAAEWLLREGIVQALWSVDGGECPPPELRWAESIRSVAAEIPKSGPLTTAVVDLLSGIGGPEHFRSYVAEDALPLETCPVP